MHSQGQLDLISKIYDLPLRPENWQSVLDEFSLAMNSVGATLLAFDPMYSEHHLSIVSSIFTPAFAEDYGKRFGEQDQTAYSTLLMNPKRGFVTDMELLGIHWLEEQGNLPAVKWLNEHLGIRHRAGTCLNLKGIWIDVLAVQHANDRGPITDHEKKAGLFFLDHFAKTIELGRSFGVLKNRFNGVLTALDRFHIGIFVLSPNGSVVVKNREADRILEAGDGLTLTREGQLQPINDGEQRGKLKDAISQAVQTAQAGNDQAETLMTLPRRNGKDPYLVEVTPFRDHDEIESQFTGCLVFVIDPAKTDVVSTQGMQALYNLTGSETEVCKLLAQGLDTGEVAETRNLTTETVRSYVRQIFHKTGTNNRSQLVRLALTVNLPIDPGPDDE